jgi:hypothetical protein
MLIKGHVCFVLPDGNKREREVVAGSVGRGARRVRRDQAGVDLQLSRFGEKGAQGTFGTSRGAFGTIQGTTGNIQGAFGTIQGTTGTIQGTTGTIQGTIGTIPGISVFRIHNSVWCINFCSFGVLTCPCQQAFYVGILLSPISRTLKTSRNGIVF